MEFESTFGEDPDGPVAPDIFERRAAHEIARTARKRAGIVRREECLGFLSQHLGRHLLGILLLACPVAFRLVELVFCHHLHVASSISVPSRL